MYNLEGDATNKMMNLGVQMLDSGFKLGGSLAKEALLLVLEKVKETKENKIGLTSIKKMLKSKEELNVLNLGKEHLDFFKSEAKRLGVGFASVGDKDSDVTKIIYKTKDVSLIKNIMQDILDKTKGEINRDELSDNSIFKLIDKIDFKEHDENVYRHEVTNIDKEKAMAIKELLYLKGIEGDAVAKEVLENGNLTLDYKVNEADREKAIDIIDNSKDKSLEEILEEINKLEAERDKPKVINPDEQGLAKYGINVETKEYEDRWGNKKETHVMKIGDKEVNHALDEKHYSSIEDTLRRLGFSKGQIEELKKEDKFVQSRLKKEDFYLNRLNKSNQGKEPLDVKISRAKQQNRGSAINKKANKSKDKER